MRASLSLDRLQNLGHFLSLAIEEK